MDIEIFDNEDGSFYSLCPVCGANVLAWRQHDAAEEMMNHINDEHTVEQPQEYYVPDWN